jgi:hypothetical protein
VNTCPVCHVTHSPRCDGSRRLRWPAAPLFDLIGPTRSVMETLGVSGTDVVRAAERGLSDRQADHWASRLGVHPSMVWPSWDRAGLTVADEVFVEGNGWRRSWEWLTDLSTGNPQGCAGELT